MGRVIKLVEHPKYQDRVAKIFIGSLKEKGRLATMNRAAAFPVDQKDSSFWSKVSASVRAYLAHSKLKPKD